MADVEEVAAAFASLIAGLVTGPGGAPLNGVQTDIVTGWPKPNDLKDTLGNGGVMISVYPEPGATSNVTRHQREWEILSASNMTATAVVNGGTITFGGTITLPLNVCVTAPGGCTALYTAVTGETLATLATGIAAALTASGVPAEATGAQVITGTGGPITVALGGGASLAREAAREKQAFIISIWAPSQAQRLATAKTFEADMLALARMSLPGGETAHLTYMRTVVSDHGELENEYRRDLYIFAEYPIIQTISGTDVVSAQITAA